MILKQQLPSEEEKAKYYYGLPSQPRLVARSNWETKWHLRKEDNHVVRKRLGHIGGHPIVDAFNNTSLYDDIIDMLDSNANGWNCLDTIRIGYEDEKTETPAVVL